MPVFAAASSSPVEPAPADSEMDLEALLDLFEPEPDLAPSEGRPLSAFGAGGSGWTPRWRRRTGAISVAPGNPRRAW